MVVRALCSSRSEAGIQHLLKAGIEPSTVAPTLSEPDGGNMLLIILLVILIFGTGYGGYRVGPGWGYYGGGGLSLVLTIVLILLLLRIV